MQDTDAARIYSRFYVWKCGYYHFKVVERKAQEGVVFCFTFNRQKVNRDYNLSMSGMRLS
jgi:hypothetical protein